MERKTQIRILEGIAAPFIHRYEKKRAFLDNKQTKRELRCEHPKIGMLTAERQAEGTINILQMK